MMGGLSDFQGMLLRPQEVVQEEVVTPGYLLELDEDGGLVQTVDAEVEGVWVQMADPDGVWVQIAERTAALDENGMRSTLSAGVWVQLVDNVWVQFGGEGRANATAQLKKGVWVQIAGEDENMQFGNDVWVQFQEKGAVRVDGVWVQ